jgi:hypothetical protein
MDDEGDHPRDSSLPPPPPTPGLSSGQPPVIRETVTDAERRAGLLTLAGGIVVVISVFLPWVRVEGPFGGITISEFGGGGVGLLILGGFAIARGLSMARIGGIGFRLGSPLIGGALMVVLLVVRWNDIGDATDQVHEAYPLLDVSIGIGFWGAALGAALVLAAGVLALQVRR